MYNSTPTNGYRINQNRFKVVEYVIAFLIEKLSLSWFLHFLTNPYNTGKSTNPMSDQNAIFGDKNWRISLELKEKSQTKA